MCECEGLIFVVLLRAAGSGVLRLVLCLGCENWYARVIDPSQTNFDRGVREAVEVVLRMVASR